MADEGQRLLEFLAPELGPGEAVVTKCPARSPSLRRETRNTWGEFHALMFVVDLALRRRRTRQLVERYAAAGFPVARRMELVVTTDRLIVVETIGRARRPARVVGAVDRSDIASVRPPLVGDPRWKLVEVRRTSGAMAPYFVDRTRLADFVAAAPRP